MWGAPDRVIVEKASVGRSAAVSAALRFVVERVAVDRSAPSRLEYLIWCIPIRAMISRRGHSVSLVLFGSHGL